MEYYAAALREDGDSASNSDGLMVKGYQLCDGKRLVVMAFCEGRKLKNGKVSDRVIRELEKQCETLFFALDLKTSHGELVKGNEIEDFLEESVWGVLRKDRLSGKTALSVVCLYGDKIYAFSNTGEEIFVLDNLGITKMQGFSECMRSDLHLTKQNVRKSKTRGCVGFMSKRGHFEGRQTIFIGSTGFMEHVSENELYMNLCPQMCVDKESMECGLEELAETVRERSGGNAFSAVALCAG